MNKLDRGKLIRERASVKGFKVIFTRILNPAKSEIIEEGNLVKAHDDNSSIEDEEIAGVVSQLKFEKPKIKIDLESDILLNRKEKFQLKLDLDNLRWHNAKKKNCWIALRNK